MRLHLRHPRIDPKRRRANTTDARLLRRLQHPMLGGRTAAAPLHHSAPVRALKWFGEQALPIAALIAVGCGSAEGDAPTDPSPSSEERAASELPIDERLAKTLRSFSPLPPPPSDPTNRVADDPSARLLGQALFFDERLSSNGAVSCATCHNPERGFTDGRSLAFGIGEGRRKTPTLWNAAYHRWLTWDGRADSLWMQALDPLEDPLEMGFSRSQLAGLLHDDDELRALYESAFGNLPSERLEEAAKLLKGAAARPERQLEDGDIPEARHWRALDALMREAIDTVFVNAGKALAAYQRQLIRGDSRFDRFVAALDGSDPEGLNVLTESELKGLELFFGAANCTLCHSGPNFSDSEFHNNQLPSHNRAEADDAGRHEGARVLTKSTFNAAGPHSDAPDGEAARAIRSLRYSSETYGEFRTPSLRNLKGREPFMHQGQFSDLLSLIHI